MIFIKTMGGHDLKMAYSFINGSLGHFLLNVQL